MCRLLKLSHRLHKTLLDGSKHQMTKMPSGAWPSPLPMTQVERPCRQQFRSKTTSRWSQACTEASFYLQHVKIAHLYSNKDGGLNRSKRAVTLKLDCPAPAAAPGSQHSLKCSNWSNSTRWRPGRLDQWQKQRSAMQGSMKEQHRCTMKCPTPKKRKHDNRIQ